jgi:hypothetical protein
MFERKLRLQLRWKPGKPRSAYTLRRLSRIHREGEMKGEQWKRRSNHQLLPPRQKSVPSLENRHLLRKSGLEEKRHLDSQAGRTNIGSPVEWNARLLRKDQLPAPTPVPEPIRSAGAVTETGSANSRRHMPTDADKNLYLSASIGVSQRLLFIRLTRTLIFASL